MSAWIISVTLVATGSSATTSALASAARRSNSCAVIAATSSSTSAHIPIWSSWKSQPASAGGTPCNRATVSSTHEVAGARIQASTVSLVVSPAANERAPCR